MSKKPPSGSIGLWINSTILIPRLKEKAVSSLQVIQNAALQALLHCPFDHVTQRHVPIADLHIRAGIPYVRERLEVLAVQYFVNALLDNNPLINKCNEEFRTLCNEIPIVAPTLIGEAKIEVHVIEPLDQPLLFLD